MRLRGIDLSLRDLLVTGGVLCAAPFRWHRQLKQASVPALLEMIEVRVQQAAPLRLPLGLVAYLVRRRAVCSIRWRRRRCLLCGLLYADLLPRAGYAVTIHLGCAVDPAGLTAHCWISSPDTEAVNRLMSAKSMTELYRKTLQKNAVAGGSGREAGRFTAKATAKPACGDGAAAAL